MAQIGMFCLPWTGHLNPLCGLARELEDRGHDIIFFHIPDVAEQIRRRGFQCEVFGEKTYPAGTLPERARKLSQLKGFEAIQTSIESDKLQATALFTEAPPVIEKARLDLWVVDQLEYAASTLAAILGAPFVTAILGLMIQHEDGVPGYSGEPYSSDAAVLERDRRYKEGLRKTTKPYHDFIGAYRLRAGLGPFSHDTLWSSLAQITQQPAGFEFPRKKLPACFHFTGPFTGRAPRPFTPFPWERLSEKPLIYVSFGTMQNQNRHLYEVVARAVADLDAQVVVSLGGAETAELPRDLPGNLLVVNFAPQLEILKRAALMVTHAGMNSALECLAAGVPMVAVPLVSDGPAVAARIEWTGAGLRIPAAECNPVRLRGAIERVLREDSFRKSAQAFQQTIRATDGLRRAAEIIEQVLATGRPVLRESPDSPART